MELKFKNIGWFSEGLSARYKAKINENLFVEIEKHSNPFKGFAFQFITKAGYNLDSNIDLLSNWYDGLTKKDTIAELTNMIADTLLVEKLTRESKRIDNDMKNYN